MNCVYRGGKREGCILDVSVHLALLHELNAFIKTGAHLRELLLHLLNLCVGGNLLCRGDLNMLISFPEGFLPKVAYLFGLLELLLCRSDTVL